ncbi:cation:proton antiporter [Endothiovibrio diazotrophicus]
MEHAAHTADLVATVVGLLLIAAATLALCKRIKLPFTVALVLVGMGLSGAAAHGPAFLHPMVEYEVSPGVILFVFLPTLIFESAFNLDARQLRSNLLPILTLAVPGLILSTALIGVLVWLATPIELPAALLLGAILSATDPVAVISIFKQLGAPKRLTILVEGESLFNDATAIVAAKILVGVVAAGYFTADSAVGGAIDFFQVFLGGVLVGWLLALATGWLLGGVEGDPYIEISLTTILAYSSFLIAEEAFHVSGVMSTVAAAITMGGWGRTKISPSVADYLEHFWEYMAFVANALIFLLVGLRVDLGALAGSLDLLPWVILAMLVSRAVVVYGLVPLVGYFSAPIHRAYQTVMFWGGLRGAIALAIVLSLEFEFADTFVALAMGSVLFTLVVQGLTIEGLVKRLGLDQPPLADRLARVEGLLASKQRALARIPELQTGGLFSARVAERLTRRTDGEVERLLDQLAELRSRELGETEEQRLLFTRCLGTERSYYHELFSQGHLSERAYRDLGHSLDLQLDALRQERPLPGYTLHPPHGGWSRRISHWLVERGWELGGLADRLGLALIARDYEEAWGRYRGAARVIDTLAGMAAERGIDERRIAVIHECYRGWFEAARRRLDSIAAQFPEFVGAMQERLAGRLVVHAQEEVIEAEARAGTLPAGVAERVVEELEGEVRVLRGSDLSPLRIGPEELLRKVPFFATTPKAEFERVAALLKRRMVPDDEAIIRQGEMGESLFLIARGVVRVSRADDGGERDLATLMAGDFFGEMALLHHAPRTATCRAVTPCALYELKRHDFDALRSACPAIQAALEEADSERKLALEG